MSAQLVQFPTPDYRDPVKALRNLADEIEAGEYGEVGCCAVVILGDTMEVFGSGADSAEPSVAALLQAGNLRLIRALDEHGQD